MKTLLLFVSWLLCSGVCTAQESVMPEADRIRIAEVFRLADAVQDSVWANWSSAPFAFLLITPDTEFLVRHPAPPEDFVSAGYDAALGDTVYTRPRVYDPRYAATFPIQGVPTIVLGQPAQTGFSDVRWIVTALHEHFHQLQYSHPDYYPAATALDLAGEDPSGMWMLNYPFPYEDPDVQALFEVLKNALLEALVTRETEAFGAAWKAYRNARQQLQAHLADKDERYLSFQLWQEGVARYVQYRVAEVAASHGYVPSEAFVAMAGTVDAYAELAARMREDLEQELAELSLEASQRVAFYSIGAGEARLLDAVRPEWRRRRYFENLFVLESQTDEER